MSSRLFVHPRSALTPLPEDMSPVNAVQAALVDRYEPGGVSCADWEFRVPRARLDDYLADNLDGQSLRSPPSGAHVWPLTPSADVLAKCSSAELGECAPFSGIAT